jgi:L-alanine-DL-glutamate epimerase-like enolase superfamily enzyme
VELRARPATLTLAETFTIARSSEDEAEVVHVTIEHAGHTGCGEAAPIERYDESAESALAFLEGADELLGDDPGFDLTPYRLERFARGEAIPETAIL